MSDSQKMILAAGVALLTVGIGLFVYEAFGDTLFSSIKYGQAHAELREADEYLRQNSPDAAKQALAICTRVLARGGSPRINQLARYGMGLALEKLEDFGAAREQYRILSGEDIADPELAVKVEYSLGKLLLFVNHEEEGKSRLNLLLARTEDNRLKSKIHTAFGNFYLRKSDLQRARENFNIALKYYPENIQAELGRADALHGEGRTRAAHEFYDDYLFGDSNLDPAAREKVLARLNKDLYQAGVRSYRKRDYNDAIYFFKRTLEANVDEATVDKANYWMGESLGALGKTDAALKAYDAVLSDGDSTMDQAALIQKGIIRFHEKKYRDAVALFQAAVKDYPAGPYTSKAREWQRETSELLYDRNIYLEYNRRPGGAAADYPPPGPAPAMPAPIDPSYPYQDQSGYGGEYPNELYPPSFPQGYNRNYRQDHPNTYPRPWTPGQDLPGRGAAAPTGGLPPEPPRE